MMKMNRTLLFVLVSLFALVFVGCSAGREKTTAPPPSSPTAEVKQSSEQDLALQAFQKGGCGACHVIPGVPGANGSIGPDLSQIAKVVEERIASGAYQGKAKTAEAYLLEAIEEPDAFLAPDCGGAPCQSGLMPSNYKEILSDEDIEAIVHFLLKPPAAPSTALEVAPTPSAVSETGAPLLNEEQFAWAKQVYFERCAGCHGTLRKGATGPALTPDKTVTKGTLALQASFLTAPRVACPIGESKASSLRNKRKLWLNFCKWSHPLLVIQTAH